MKIIYSIFLLVLSLNLFAQQIDKSELIDTEWFCENSKNNLSCDSINVGLKNTIYLERRVFPHVDRDSSIYGNQVLQSLSHGDYAVFWFREKKSLGYSVIFDNYFSLITIGETPSWSWTYRKNNKTFTFSYPNRPDIEFTLVSCKEKNVNIDGEKLVTQIIGLKRIK